ncbi:heterokaryon incompatibility protein-domain-containing protein [Lasiosphaeris hirsuta]|uniref:Heterokaryon incompatibility protein-domain-containing protein n=1 Tax=Lasiosphaeris hirsuta TaxID=260670 RepID=A0AA39ZSG4_9PEZI|nr:heterokaryon incompatibility protein-domain-containing protein [Lasiosphaeris hirsuta]
MQQPILEGAGLGLSPDEYYTYAKLPTPTSIRLVKLQSVPTQGGPRDHFAPIRLSIRVVDLEDHPTYEALSYTWSRPLTVFSSAEERDGWTENRFPVLCDGKVLLVTRNLFTYLHEWRSLCALKTRHSPHTREQAASAGLELPEEIWIDALSINQNEADEKGRQVALMGRIYRQTRKITIWLGPEDVFTRPALDILLTLGNTPLSSAKTARHMSEAARCRVLSLPPWDSSQWWSVFAFLQRSWFRRSWVIQEVALAPQARMQCGKLMFRWEILVRACINLTESGLGDTMDMWAWFEISGPKLNTPLWVEEMNPIITHSQRPDEDRRLFTTLNRRQPSYLALIVLQQVKIDGVREPHGRQATRKSEPIMQEECSRIPLSRLLDDCRGCDASDPRDKIYALLDIARGPAYQLDSKLSHTALRPIRADYHLSATEVYLEAAWHILLSSATLDLLSSQHLLKDGESESKVHGLPSWVPDWSTGPPAKRLANPFGPEWMASRGHRWVPPPESGLYQPFLAVEGVLVDTVAAVADTSSELRFSPTDSAVLASQSGYPGFSLTKSAVVAAGLPRHYPWTEGGQEPGEVLWRTLIADTIHGKSPAPIAYHAVFYDEWVQTAKRAGADFHSDHGLGDPEKEAEWERVWMNWDALFPEEHGRPLQDQAATEAVDHSVELYEDAGEDMEESASSPKQEGSSAHATTASGVANSRADKFGLYKGWKKQEMGKSQIEIIFDEMVDMCIEDSEKDSSASGDDEEKEDRSEGRTEGETSSFGLYEDEMSIIRRAIALGLDEEIGGDEQQPDLTLLYSAIEELEDRATHDPALQAALLAARRGFRRVGDSIIATHCQWSMDLSAEREKLAKAVQGLLTDDVSQQPERPGTPMGMQPISKDGEVLSEADIHPQETTETEEMAAALLSCRKRVSSGRAIFRTEKHYLGNGPRSVIPGDQVWVLAGAVVPIVLRRRGNGRFTLVGEAFVHGIMKGEIFEKESAMKIEIE